MPRLLRKLAVCGLLTAYGTIALLGHAGLHAVGGHHHSHSHGLDNHAASAAEDHHHHGGCHHHHHDQPPAGQSSGDEHHPGHDHGPLHDDDNCSICHFFAAHGWVLTQAAPLHADAQAEPVLIPAAPRLPGAEQFQLPIRGPPAC